MPSLNSSEKKFSSESEKKKEKIDISQYKDPTGGLTIKKLERSLWLFEHKSHFKKGLIIALFLICVLTWGYTLYYVTMYLAVGMKRDAMVMRGLSINQLPGHEYTLKIAPKPLVASNVQSINLKDEIDIITQVKNPNSRHYAYFDYCFIAGDKELDCNKTFIHPEDTKYIFNLGEDLSEGRFNIKFSIKKTQWNLLDKHKIPDWKEYKKNRLNIKFQDTSFTSAKSSDLSDKIDIANLSFTAFNDTSYNFHKVPLNIILLKGNKIIGVNRHTLTNFYSQEKVPVELFWPQIKQNANEVKIIPDVNVFNEENYFAPRR